MLFLTFLPDPQAMCLLGLGSDNLIKVDCDESFRVDVARMKREAMTCLEKNFKVRKIEKNMGFSYARIACESIDAIFRSSCKFCGWEKATNEKRVR